MSSRDPLLELAELVLRNLEDWRAELALAEPGRSGSWVTLTTIQGGKASGPVERYLVRRDDLAATLKAVERRLHRMSPALRAVYRAVYRPARGKGKRAALAGQLDMHERTLGREIRRIRALVAGTLANLGPRRLRGLLK